MHFTTVAGLHINKPVLYIDNSVIPYTERQKSLNWWDPKLTWREHIAGLRADCMKAIGMMKIITCQQWGADQRSTMKIYRTYIRSKLYYDAPIYASEASTIFQSLNTITTEAIRIATGAFRSTPTATLHVLANEMTLEHRRAYLSLRYYYKIKK